MVATVGAAFFGAVTGAKDMAETEVLATSDVIAQTFLGTLMLASKATEYIPLSSTFQNTAEGTTRNLQNLSNNVHDFLRDAAPYKEGFDDSEFVINTALLADGGISIGNIIRNFPKKFSTGQIALAELGINIPVVCADGSIVLTKSGDLASIGGAGGAIYNMDSNSGDGSGGNEETKSNDSEPLSWKEFEAKNRKKFATDENGTAKQKMSDAWKEYKKENYPNGGEHYLNDRPNLRKSTTDKIEYSTDSQGRIIDENTGEAITEQMDIGHKQGFEAWRCRKAAEELGWNQSQYNEFMNNPDFYQYESHTGNISHAGEEKSKDLSKIISVMKKFEESGYVWK